jgi:Na+/H+-dicarboxylate symporter
MTPAARRPASVLPIIVAMGAGVGCGAFLGPAGRALGIDWLPVLDLTGDLFINALKMVVVPLVSACIVTGMAGVGSGRELGRLWAKTIAFYLLTTLLAVLVALGLVDLIQPGLVNGQPARFILALKGDAASIAAHVQEHALGGFHDTLESIVPANILEAAAANKMLGVMFFSILFGYLLARLELPSRQAMLDFWNALLAIMMRMTELVMRAAPLGVFALTARVIARAGIHAAGPILSFAGCVVVGIAFYALIVLPLLLRMAGVSRPYRLFPALGPAMLAAFSTASSAAALGVSLECLQSRARVSKRIASFVMPLGASLNHVGSALYECAGAMFLCQAYGVHLTFGVQVVISLLALVTSMGVATIPAAALVTIALILSAVGLPAEAIGPLMVVERILDMLRTSLNVFADGACTVIVARLEGEKDVLGAPVASPPVPVSSVAPARQ